MALDALPKPEFRLKAKHLWHILDIAVILVLFMGAGRVYMGTRGVKVMDKKASERAVTQGEGVRLLAQADSVVAATRANLTRMLQDSVASFAEFERRRQALEDGIQQRQILQQQIFPLSETVLSLKERTQEALEGRKRYENEVASRDAEIDSLRRSAAVAAERLAKTKVQREQASTHLYQARKTVAYEPKGNFPERTGLMVRHEQGTDSELTSLELQQILWQPGRVDVGLALGVGLGSGQSVSEKAVGFLVTRPLIHRRLGLDLGGGYSFLTEAQGLGESGAYASAGLRLAPFYSERLHLGLGARARNGEVLPFLGVSLGRR